MNNTNRGLNRFGVFVFGLVLFAVGIAAVLAAALPEWSQAWKSVAGSVDEQAKTVIDSTTIAGLETSWLLIALPVICLVLIVVLIAFIVRHGRGQSAILVKSADGADALGGSVIVDGRVAEQAIQHALDTHPGLVSSDVSTFAVKGTPVLRITTNVRRGVSPQAVRSFVDETVAAWDSVLGREVPVLIQINAGLATRVAKATRVAPGTVPPADPATE